MDLVTPHNLSVKNIQTQMEDFFARGQKVKIYHGSTNSTRAQKFEKDKFVDVSSLNNILEINTTESYILVEPNVPMDKLVEETLKYGLIPPVVMEFPGITVGGGIQGGAGESSSFKHGLFHDICLEYEVVLGNGELIKAMPTENEDLFYGTACSYGSLGIITLVKLRLIPAKEYVHLTYHTVKSFDEAVNFIKEKTNTDAEFIDSILFEKNRGVVMVGNLSDKKDLPISTFHKASDEWFYLHADKISQKHENYKEIIPIRDYLFRSDRGAFWMGRYGFNYFNLPFNRFARFVCDKFMRTRVLYKLLHTRNFFERFFIQDFCLPKNSAVKFLDYVHNNLQIYPIWLVAIKTATKEKLSLTYVQTDLNISVGVYGEVNLDHENFVKINKNFEKVVKDLGGRKWLYAHQYYSEEEFWQIYDQAWYDALREKYFATPVFPDVYEKTKVVEKYKQSLIKGIWSALISHKIRIS